MSRESHERAFQFDEACRAARRHSKYDVDVLLRPCPASQAQIFVVPVRYALAEAPLTHPMCPPVEPLASHAMAARRLRCGYLYAWHHEGPLTRYAVAVDGLLLEQPLDAPAGSVAAGSLRGLALDKHEEAWLCFTEHPIGPAQCEQLGAREVRAQYMRHLDLRRVANTLCAPHCPPLDDAERVIGELMPPVYSAALAVEFARHGADQRRTTYAMGEEVDRQPTEENIRRYHEAKRQYRERRAASHARSELDATSPMPGAWSAERWDAIGVKNWLEQVRFDVEPLYAVFACLDDEFGVLRDINHEQAQVQAGHEQWLQDHGLRLQVGGFVRSLLEESASELAGIITYRYLEQDIQLTSAQGETLLKAHHELDDLLREETAINHHTRRKYGDKQARAELYALSNRKATCLRPVRAFIPAELHNEIEAVVREYRAEKVENLNKWNGPQVEDYIDLQAMNTWLEQTAPAQFAQVRLRQELLLKDRGRYLYQHQRPSWFIATDDLPTRRWLDDLASDCLSEQCQSQPGADQYAEYVRSTDRGILRQLFFAWTPNLEGSLVSASRMGEIETALALDNRDQAVLVMYKLLMPLSREVMHELTLMGGPLDTKWSLLVNRLGAALLSLGKGMAEGAGMSPAWASLMVMARLSIDSPLRWVNEGGQRTLRFVGGAGQALGEWTQRAAMGIKLGKVENITNAPIVQNSGGVLPLVVMVLNVMNARKYLFELQAVARPDEQRVYDATSSVLYAGAALLAVVDNQVRKGAKLEFFKITKTAIPYVTVLGALIGSLSGVAALQEFRSLTVQLESSTSVDPWLQMRRNVVGGVSVAYGLQALAGFYWTARVLLGLSAVGAAIVGYAVWVAPILIAVTGLGVLYFITWLFQQTPLQRFLDDCCWSKDKARNLEPITLEAQRDELERLIGILHTPRVSFSSSNHVISSPRSPRSIEAVSVIDSVTIDLPGADPSYMNLELAMIGYAVDQESLDGQAAGLLPETQQPPRTWIDLVPAWLAKSNCEWIPVEEGHGLRLRGNFAGSRNFSNPAEVTLRIRFRTPFMALLGESTFVGGESGMTFSLSNKNGVLSIRNEAPDGPGYKTNYVLARDSECSGYLQPRVKM